MTISPTAVHFDDLTMWVDLTDGRSVRVPLTWFPRLLHATREQREHVEISRIGLHWEDIDEDISVEGLLAGRGDTTTKARALHESLESKSASLTSAPKVFVSYASEDKSFVLGLATALRAAGVDAWVDEWEIRPGDSLVQKIFDEGIGQAAVVIVVLSNISVRKKWVREELDAAVVGRINQTSRLIPIVLDTCEIPKALQATKWIRAQQDLQEVADEVARVIFRKTEKPPLGAAPAYVRPPLADLPGLDPIDLQVLHAIGEQYFQRGSSYLSKSDVLGELSSLRLDAGQIDESLEILSDFGYISPRHAIGQKFAGVTLESLGAATILRNKFPEFDAHYQQVSAVLINNEERSNEAIARHLSLPLVLVDHILDDLESKGLIRMSKSISGPRHVFDISARLKRAF